MDKLKKNVYDFVLKYNLSVVTSETISAAIIKEGYTVVEYSPICSDENVEVLLTSLGLSDYAKTVRAFTYADKNMRIVFITEGLSEKEKCILLAHEAGHIMLNHISSEVKLMGRSIVEENEANTFSHILLNPPSGLKFRLFAKRHKTAIILCTVLFVTVILGIALGTVYYNHNVKEDYCITTSGQKYHKIDCPAVQGHKIITGTKKEFIKLGKGACSICIK